MFIIVGSPSTPRRRILATASSALTASAADRGLSVTITGPVLATADAYATAALARHGRSRVDGSTGGHEAMTILADETARFTAGFPTRCLA